MRISELLKNDRITISFEVFPPKTSDKFDTVLDTARAIAGLHPDFMSVTYGAGGGTSEFTADIAADLQKTYDVPMLAHLTCVSSTKDYVAKTVESYKEKGIENIMALRGDIPKEGRIAEDYHHACELIYDLKEKGDFCIGGACYPEGHVHLLQLPLPGEGGGDPCPDPSRHHADHREEAAVALRRDVGDERARALFRDRRPLRR